MASIGNIIAPLLISFILKIRLSWQFLYLYLIIPQIAMSIMLFFVKIPEKNFGICDNARLWQYQ